MCVVGLRRPHLACQDETSAAGQDIVPRDRDLHKLAPAPGDDRDHAAVLVVL
jgi:hypothetical protein